MKICGPLVWNLIDYISRQLAVIYQCRLPFPGFVGTRRLAYPDLVVLSEKGLYPIRTGGLIMKVFICGSTYFKDVGYRPEWFRAVIWSRTTVPSVCSEPISSLLTYSVPASYYSGKNNGRLSTTQRLQFQSLSQARRTQTYLLFFISYIVKFTH